MPDNDEIRTQREILRSIENTLIETKTIVEGNKTKLEDHETRIRKNEKGLIGILATSAAGLLSGIKAWLT